MNTPNEARGFALLIKAPRAVRIFEPRKGDTIKILDESGKEIWSLKIPIPTANPGVILHEVHVDLLAYAFDGSNPSPTTIFLMGQAPFPSINQKTAADTLSRLFYHGHPSEVASLMPGRQEPGKVNAEEGAGDRDEAGDGKMSDLASSRLAENDSTDPSGDTGCQLLNGGVYAHKSAAMASLDAGGHQSHRRNEPAGHTNHEQGGDCHGNHQRHGGKICDQKNGNDGCHGHQ